MAESNPDAGLQQAEEATPEARLISFYAKTGTAAKEEPTPAEAPPAPEAEQVAEGQAAEEAPEGEAVAAEEEPAEDQQSAADIEFEIVHNGKQHKLSRAETIQLAQQGFDYTQKTQAVAAKEKQVQEALDLSQQVMQIQIALADDLAQVKAFERSLQPYQNVDWVALATQEPLEYPKHRAQYDQLVQGFNAAAGQYRQKAESVLQGQKQAADKILSTEAQKLAQINPRWSDQAKFQADAQEIAQYGIKEGYRPDEMNSIRDARYVNTLWKALQYDKLQASKATVMKQARQAPPTAKPGAAGTTQSSDQQRLQKMRQTLKKSGSWQDAAALLAKLK